MCGHREGYICYNFTILRSQFARTVENDSIEFGPVHFVHLSVAPYEVANAEPGERVAPVKHTVVRLRCDEVSTKFEVSHKVSMLCGVRTL